MWSVEMVLLTAELADHVRLTPFPDERFDLLSSQGYEYTLDLFSAAGTPVGELAPFQDTIGNTVKKNIYQSFRRSAAADEFRQRGHPFYVTDYLFHNCII